MSEAVLTCYVNARRAGQDHWTLLGVWRGPNAPVAPLTAPTLRGSVQEFTLDSPALGGARARAHPGPVLYMADGQDLHLYAPVLEPLMVARLLPRRRHPGCV
ncbi:MAG TPA: hypothetical protein VGO93_08510 [Candidatus Xenobia bacterium]